MTEVTIPPRRTFDWDGSIRRVCRSEELLYASWKQIAASRKLTAWRAISGGSAAAGASRESIRARLAMGTLPRLDGRAGAMRATGSSRCACCRQAIQRGETQYEPRD